jgi:dihydrofolate reductase
MRTVTYGAACSLDGFIVGPGGALDWLLYSKDVQAYMRDYWARLDTLVMGRKTWQAANAQSGGKGGGMKGVKSYVFSRTPRTPASSCAGSRPRPARTSASSEAATSRARCSRQG